MSRGSARSVGPTRLSWVRGSGRPTPRRHPVMARWAGATVAADALVGELVAILAERLIDVARARFVPHADRQGEDNGRGQGRCKDGEHAWRETEREEGKGQLRIATESQESTKDAPTPHRHVLRHREFISKSPSACVRVRSDETVRNADGRELTWWSAPPGRRCRSPRR